VATADRRWAAHLLRRAGFGAGPDELDRYAALGFEGAVERLLAPQQVDDSATTDLLAGLTPTLAADTRIVDGQALWLVRMLYTQRSLQEKMALFWHNHFATSVQKVHVPALMYAQNDLFRTRGLGRFDDLLAGVARDPAMIFWLDNNTNRRGHANENWGREVMELFTIGIGNYTEQDVREVARAFTGWSATRDGAYRFLPRQHDPGAKTVLGHTGNLDGGDVLTILAGMRQTGLLLGRKLWRWFVNDMPAPDGVNRLADVYVQSNHDITAMLRALLLSPEFRAEANYYTTVKNPPEFVVGTLKLLGLDAGLRDKLRPPLLRSLAQAVSQMGMPLFAPPNVGGWPGGRGWINPGTYFARANFVEHLLALAAGQSLPDLAAHAGGQGRATPDAIVAALLELALPTAPPAPLQGPLVTYLGGDTGPLKRAGLWRLVLSSPSYQLN
jgi:uncharacterized protein (DUF1800 family)